MATLDRETQNKVGLMTFVIIKFARTYKMDIQQVFHFFASSHQANERHRDVADDVGQGEFEDGFVHIILSNILLLSIR